MTLATKPEVFIVESLNFRDEQLERYEGQIISKILALSGKQCHYYYIRTQRELEVVLTKFTKSTYRYLHFSCHGNNKNIYTTLDEIPFARFGALLMPHLREKRLFVSACSVANNRLAKNVLL